MSDICRILTGEKENLITSEERTSTIDNIVESKLKEIRAVLRVIAGRVVDKATSSDEGISKKPEEDEEHVVPVRSVASVSDVMPANNIKEERTSVPIMLQATDDDLIKVCDDCGARTKYFNEKVPCRCLGTYSFGCWLCSQPIKDYKRTCCCVKRSDAH